MRLKEFIKNSTDNIVLYRAYALKDGDSINLNTDGVPMYFNVEDAVQGLLNHNEDFHKDMWSRFVETGKIDIVVLVKTIIPIHNQKDKLINPDIDECYNEESGCLNIVLSNFEYDLDVEEIEIIDISFKIDSKTEIKTLTHLKYESLTNPTKKKKKDK